MNPQDLNARNRLSAKKLALLEQQLREEMPDTARFSPILPRAERGRAPLSFAQQRLWFLDQLMPGSPFYNIYNIVRLTYPINLTALDRSLQEIVRRHEVFRTRFTVQDGEPVQLIAATTNAQLRVIDLRSLPAADREAEAQRLATEEARQPFDLSTGPLLRTFLLQLGESESLIMISMHHIATDGWSMGIFFSELNALYEAFAMGRPSPLPELPIQYADFAVWQRAMIQGENRDRELRYWKQQLAAAPILQLPTDRPRGAVQSFRGACQAFVFPRALNDSLKELGRREGVTLFMTLLAAFQTLIYHYTGQDDIVVGSPIAGRTRTELEQLIGFFVNTLVMRTRLSGELSFRALLRHVQKVALEAYAHQNLPFEMLVEELHPDRDLSRNPIFQVMFQVMSVAGSQAEPTAADLPLEIANNTAKFDLTLTLTDTGGPLTGAIEYNTDLFDDATITRLIGHYRTLLEGIVADPDAQLADLPLLGSAEGWQQLIEWNATASVYPRERCVYRLFEEQAATSPDAPALTFGEKTLCYRELNEQANQLAHFLRRIGVKLEQPVGICLERSPELIIGTIGILKAGGAYLPLDPAYPKKRLAAMLADAGVQMVLTHSTLRELIPGEVMHTICLDADWQTIARESVANIAGSEDGGRLAYIMYTSGSTGIPKGIAIPHRAISRLVLNTNYIAMGPGDRVAHGSNCAFDASTFEIWGALLNGAEIIGVPKDVTVSYQEYARYIYQQRIGVLFLTTALFNQIAQHAPRAFHSVRDLMVGGEAIDPRWMREVQAQGPPARLMHVYGPTESTTYATWYLVTAVPPNVTTIPIGRPVANTQIYLLNKRLRPVPVGVPGELYIGGDGLARGYVNQPALTAERFIPDPFSATPGARMYKTGDLVRYRGDGSVEFIGRIDHQVKLRGFRIELGEIQASLEAYDGVSTAVVMLCEDRPGDKRLIAYLVLDPGAALAADALRGFLRERLPEYMIPAAFVALESMPLNANGKIDRAALPRPSDDVKDGADAFVAPQTRNEKLLATIWQDVLGRTQVGAHDNFFDLGGHSLLMARVLNRLREALKHDISMIDLFQYPSISRLARYLDSLDAPPTPEPAADQRQQHVQERVARQKQAAQKRAASQRDRRDR